MKKSLIVGGMFFIIIIIFGGYFLIRNNTRDSSIVQKDRLQDGLLVAENKLKKEKETLNLMIDDLRNSFILAVSVQDQMKKGSRIVSQTDFMFSDPNGLNPQLIVKNFPSIILINTERKNINLLLTEWQNKTDILYIKKIDIKESEQIKKDAQAIKTYFHDLSYLIGILTPKNSGISQFQIDSFLSNLPLEEAIDEVLASLQTAINNSQTLDTQTAYSQTSSSSSQGVNFVTPDDVVAQQGIVDQTQIQVIALQEQLTQIEEQNSAETNINTQINSDLENQNTTNTDSTNDDTNLTNQNDSSVNDNLIDDHQGIIIQSGLPQLIQGTNQY